MTAEDQLRHNLRKLRMAKQPPLSQASFAAKMGIERHTYSRYERGVSAVPAWLMVKAAQYYGVKVEDLFGDFQKKKR